jgi:hypothetical protein
LVTIDGGNVSGEKTLLEWAFPECGKLNLATQARFRKITVINKAEQERKQREAEERAVQAKREEERRAKEKREQEEWEAQVQAEREAEAKREQEAREDLAKREQEEQEARFAELRRLEEESERFRAAHKAELEKRQRAKETAQALIMRLLPISSAASVRDKLNKQQFTEFMAIYQDYIAAKTNYNSLQGLSYDPDMMDLEMRYRDLEHPIKIIIESLDKNQKKQFEKQFGTIISR